MRGVTQVLLADLHQWQISTHTPHAGRDSEPVTTYAKLAIFQLTRPMRGVTWTVISATAGAKFQLTRPMRGVTDHAR